MQASNLELFKLNNLKLAAKIISEQLKHGVHLGKRVGVGAEFEQYRHYAAGDDPKRIDWKYYSRSGKHMIKESPGESQLQIRLMLDLSGSMNYEEDGVIRLSYAKNLLASLAYLAHLQGDSMTFFTLKNGQVQQKVAASPKSFQRILYHLQEETAEGNWPIVKQDFPVLKSKQRELIILVSDFLQKENEWLEIVDQMRHPKKEIVLFQLLGNNEVEFELKGNFRFQDLESDRSIILDGDTVRKTYNSAIQSYLETFKKELQLPQVRLFQIRLTDSIAGVINNFVAQKS